MDTDANTFWQESEILHLEPFGFFFPHIMLILKCVDLSSVVSFLTGLHYSSDRRKQKETHSVDFWQVKQNRISSPPSVLSFRCTACSQQPRLWAGALTQTDLSRSERVIPHARGSPVIRILIWQERQKVELPANAIVKTNARLSKKKGKRKGWDGFLTREFSDKQREEGSRRVWMGWRESAFILMCVWQ